MPYQNKMGGQVKIMPGYFRKKRVLLTGLVFSLALLGTAMYLFAKKNNWLHHEFNSQARATEMNNNVTLLRLYIKNAESAERGYAITGDKKFIEIFDSNIDSIHATYKQVQHLENRENDKIDYAQFLKSDSLVEQKIAFMRRVKLLCDNNDFKAARALIATNVGLNLSDSITAINKKINNEIQAALQLSHSIFLKENTRNNNLGYFSIGISVLLIGFIFYFLIRAAEHAGWRNARSGAPTSPGQRFHGGQAHRAKYLQLLGRNLLRFDVIDTQRANGVAIKRQPRGGVEADEGRVYHQGMVGKPGIGGGVRDHEEVVFTMKKDFAK